MSTLKNQVSELMENQKHMLEAIKYLDGRIVDVIEKANSDKGHEVQGNQNEFLLFNILYKQPCV